MFLDKRQILRNPISSKTTQQRFVWLFRFESYYSFCFFFLFFIYIYIFKDVDIAWYSRIFASKAISLYFLVGEVFLFILSILFIYLSIFISLCSTKILMHPPLNTIIIIIVINVIVIYSLRVFLHQIYLTIFHWGLSDNKLPQVSRIILSILAVLNNVVVWMVSTCPLISKSFSPFNNTLVTVPKAPIMIGIIVTFMLHSFFNSLARSRYLFFSHSFSFILWSTGAAKSGIL